MDRRGFTYYVCDVGGGGQICTRRHCGLFFTSAVGIDATTTTLLLCPITMSSEAENAPSSSGAAMLNQPIVMDCGTATIKAGFAGGTKPKVRLFFMKILIFHKTMSTHVISIHF